MVAILAPDDKLDCLVLKEMVFTLEKNGLAFFRELYCHFGLISTSKG